MNTYERYMPGEIKNKLHLSQNSIFFLSGALGKKNSPQPLTVNVVRKRFKNFKAIYSSPSIKGNKKYSKKDFLPPKIHKPVCFSRDIFCCKLAHIY